MSDYADREADAAGEGLPVDERRAYAGGSLPLRHFLEGEAEAERKPERVHPRIAAAVLALAETPANDADALLLRRGQLASAILTSQRAGSSPRNLPCPCGSGTKFKKCCGSVAATRPTQPPQP